MAAYAVLRRWPDGAHDVFGLCDTPRLAQLAADADRRFWRRGPWRPTEHRVVAISEADFNLHRRRPDCRSPDCP